MPIDIGAKQPVSSEQMPVMLGQGIWVSAWTSLAAWQNPNEKQNPNQGTTKWAGKHSHNPQRDANKPAENQTNGFRYGQKPYRQLSGGWLC